MDNLERIAVRLDRLPADPQARVGYDLFAGGLRWSDEIPEFDESMSDDGIPTMVGLGEFRALLHYRSSLILAEPNERIEALWQRAIQLCPNWPGFLLARRDPALSATLKAKREAGERSWREAEARFEQPRPAARTRA